MPQPPKPAIFQQFSEELAECTRIPGRRVVAALRALVAEHGAEAIIEARTFSGCTTQPERARNLCNLYSVTKGQAAIIVLARAMRDASGNLASQPGRLSGRQGPRSAQRARRHARVGDAALGKAGRASVRRRADHQHSQHEVRPLAGLAAAGKPGASFRSIRSASTPTQGRARRRCGSPSVRIGGSRSLQGYGRLSMASEAPRLTPSRASIICSGF